MKRILINIFLIIIIIAFTGSCCIIPWDNLGRLTGSVEDNMEVSSTDTEIIDHGTFNGVPQNNKLSNVLISGQAIDIDISENYSYVTNDLGTLYIINISDKERPYITGKCRDIDSANIVIVEDDTAYVSYTEWIPGENDYYTECGFKVVDISDKEDPKVIGDYSSGKQNKT